MASNHKARLQKLEWDAHDQPAQEIRIIEIHKQYEDGPTIIETVNLERAGSGSSLSVSEELPNAKP